MIFPRRSVTASVAVLVLGLNSSTTIITAFTAINSPSSLLLSTSQQNRRQQQQQQQQWQTTSTLSFQPADASALAPQSNNNNSNKPSIQRRTLAAATSSTTTTTVLTSTPEQKEMESEETMSEHELASLDLSKTIYISSMKSPKDAYVAFAEKGKANAKMAKRKILHQSILGGCYVGFGALLSLSVAGMYTCLYCL
jgi:hypothetical protein